jgi:hypothetical protein
MRLHNIGHLGLKPGFILNKLTLIKHINIYLYIYYDKYPKIA